MSEAATTVERTSSAGDSLWRRLTLGVRRLRQRYDWAGFAGADWADHVLSVAVTDRLHEKQGRSTGRWMLHADGRCLTVYLKRHYRLPRWQGLLALFWPDAGWSPGMQEWRHLQWARRHGFPVPDAVAAGEFIGPWGKLQSFLAVEELTGMLPLHEAIPAASLHLDAATFRAWKRGLVLEMARLVGDLHRERRFHKDLYLCHFYVPEERILEADAPSARLAQPWHGRAHLIDLHRLGHHPWTWPLWQAKDLAQLLYSSAVEGVDARDRLRFWRAYLNGRREGTYERWLKRFILQKWRRYRDHNARRRAARANKGKTT